MYEISLTQKLELETSTEHEFNSSWTVQFLLKSTGCPNKHEN